MTTATNALHNPISPVNVEERKDLGIQAGDTIRVHLRIEEGGKTRMQIFEGMVLATKHGSEAGATFTVRRVIDGVGVERIFPLFSPVIDKIEIVRRSKVRRSKLYYIRDKAVRQIKRQMRKMIQVDRATEGELARADREAREAEEKASKEAPAEESGTEDTQEKGNKESTGKDTLPDEPTELEEKAEEQTVEENIEEINEADPEKSEIKQAEKKIEEEREERKEE